MDMALTDGRLHHGARWLWRHSVWPYLFILGALLLGFGGVRAAHLFTCHNWPTVTGEVISAQLVRGLMREGVAKASLEVTYAYTVGDVAHEGHRISFAGNKAPYEAIRAMLKQYRQGVSLPVYYHPDHPSLAVLDTAFSWRGLFHLFYGIGFMTISILGIARGWRLTSANWFDRPDPQSAAHKMRFEDLLLGFLGLLTILGIPFLWWALMKMYAGH